MKSSSSLEPFALTGNGSAGVTPAPSPRTNWPLIPVYKKAALSPSISLSSSCRILRQDGEISRRSPTYLRVYPHDSGVHGDSATSLWCPPTSLGPGASPHHLLISRYKARRRRRRHPKPPLHPAALPRRHRKQQSTPTKHSS
jgi:hypothetical protein